MVASLKIIRKWIIKIIKRRLPITVETNLAPFSYNFYVLFFFIILSCATILHFVFVCRNLHRKDTPKHSILQGLQLPQAEIVKNLYSIVSKILTPYGLPPHQNGRKPSDSDSFRPNHIMQSRLLDQCRAAERPP